MEKPEQSRKGKHCWRRIWRKFFIWMLLVTFLLIVTVLSLSGYAISKYKQDYYGSCLRSCDIMAEEFTEYSRQNPREDLLRDYIPKNMDKIAQQTDAFLYLFNQDGDCIYASENSGISADELKLSTEMRSGLQKDGEYMTDSNVGKIDHSAAEPMLTRGRTFYLVRNGEEVPYYMFASSYTRQLNVYVTHMMLLVVILFFVMLLLSGLLTFYGSWNSNRRLEQLETAMRRYVQGDYSQSIDTDSFVGTELEQVASLAEQIGSQSGRAEESSRQFVSNVSHELKTPLTSMKVLADSLLMQEEVPNELYREFMQDIAEEIDRENSIISDLLTLVKMDRKTQELNIAVTDVNEFMETILKRLRPIAEKANVEVVFESNRSVSAEIDASRLSLAFSNLVENAIKYNNENGWVRVTLDADHKFFYVKVSDSGMGIPQESLDYIFERFYRVDKSHSREIGGTGLGLAITKSAVVAHRGATKVQSKLGEGTTFTVRIPLRYIV